MNDSDSIIKIASNTLKEITGFDFLILNFIIPSVFFSGIHILDCDFFNGLNYFETFFICYGLSFAAISSLFFPVLVFGIITAFAKIELLGIKLILVFCLFLISISLGVTFLLKTFLIYNFLIVWLFVYSCLVLGLYMGLLMFRKRIAILFLSLVGSIRKS